MKFDFTQRKNAKLTNYIDDESDASIDDVINLTRRNDNAMKHIEKKNCFNDEIVQVDWFLIAASYN